MSVEALAPPRPRFATTTLLAAATLGLLLGFVYHRTAATLWRTWMTNENYSHGPLVPLVSLALAWMARGRLRAAEVRPDARGLGLVALGCALQVLALRSDVFALEGYSMLSTAFGLCLTFLGPSVTRVLLFPLAFLTFMLIFPPFVVVNLSYALKEFTVAVASRLAEAGGVLLQRSGMTLYLTGGEVRIENPCSGLRSLVALLATGALFAYLQPGAWWRRAVLFGAAVPLAMIGNAARITLVLLVAHYASVEKATGAFHDQSGYLVSGLALLGLLGLRALLRPRPRGGAA